MLCFDLPRTEQSITEMLRRSKAAQITSRIVTGIGDDCAVYRASKTEDLLFTCDMVVEGTHFIRGTHTAAQLGRKALARGLSDIAAMGGEPRFCLVALCLASWNDSRWVRGFFSGIETLARTTRTVLAGGDLSHGERMSCDVTVCGAVPRSQALLRSGARPGDRIFVTGRLGGSALGLETGRGAAWRRHVNIEPRLKEGRLLREKLRATAAMDLSDGLSLDLHRLCLASGVAAEIVAPPRFPGASLHQALHGGEDYELLFTVRPGVRVPGGMSEIGVVRQGTPGRVVLDGKVLEPAGYDHLKS